MSPRENIKPVSIYDLMRNVVENEDQEEIEYPPLYIGGILTDDEEVDNFVLEEEEESQMEQVELLSNVDSEDLEMYRQVAEAMSFEEAVYMLSFEEVNDRLSFEETPTTSNNCLVTGLFTVRRRLFSPSSSDEESE